MTSPAGARIRWQHCKDIDQQAEVLGDWQRRCIQIGTGPFHGSWLDIWLGGTVRLLREFTTAALQQHGRVDTAVLAIGIPYTPCEHILFCDQPCCGYPLLVFSGQTSFAFHSPAQMDMQFMTLYQADIGYWLDTDEYMALTRCLQTPRVLPTSPAVVQPLLVDLLLIQRHYRNHYRVMETEPACANSMARHLTRQVSMLLAASLETPAAIGRSQQHHAQLVDRVRQRAESLAADTALMNIGALCRELGTSRRTLQYAFQQTLGISPQRYLRALRLDGARRAIKQGHSVASAAATWGFWHFGRFAREYCLHFGELPSQAAARQRVKPIELLAE
ncbi:MAG: helix-turn-helix domain-containing protein [Lautropia sp.]|nr:helix-turn-helix domain-containing protein [Lautropia sp.]